MLQLKLVKRELTIASTLATAAANSPLASTMLHTTAVSIPLHLWMPDSR